MAILLLCNVGYKYPGTDKWIFRNVDLSLNSGETIRVIGRNGSGKSTLLKVLSGVLQLAEGEVSLAPKTTVAYMDQYANEMLASGLTIGEQFKVAAASRETRMPSPVDLLTGFGLDLHLRLGSFIGHLSGGQRQIVALLCTILSGATVICLDEFTSALDERSAQISEQLLQRMVSEGIVAIVLVSHSGTHIRVDRELDMSA